MTELAHARREAEAMAEQLQEQAKVQATEQQRLREAQEIGRFGSWSFDLPTGNIFWSDQLFPIFGMEVEDGPPSFDELLNKIHPDDRDFWISKVSTCIEAGTPYELEYRALFPNGEVVHHSARGQATRDLSGTVVSLSGIAQDITERKIAAQQLERGRWRLEMVLIGGDLGFWEWDINTGTRTFNERFAAIAGYELFELNPSILAWNEMVHPEDKDRVLKNLYDHVDGTTEYYESEYRIRIKSSDWHWVVGRGKVYERGADGKGLRMAGTLRDVHQQKTQAKLLEQALLDAKEATAAKSQFLANMSHEIRTPMNGILGMTQLLMDSPLDEDQRGLLKDVDDSAQSLLGIINDILDLTKVEAGKIELYPINFDLPELMKRLLAALRTKADQKGISLHYQASATVPEFLLADELRLRQVLMNLAGNALKFTPNEGSITISAKAEATHNQSLLLHFSVRDTGIGIAPEKLEAIFEPFTQADGATTRQFGGTGLGLAICKQLVQLMGGNITAISTPHQGSEFLFTILAKRGNAQMAEPESNLVESPSSLAVRPRVLLVEDNRINQKLATRLLEKLGCDVVLASDGRAAVNRIAADQKGFAIVFMDCQLPILSGYDATREIREWERGSDRHIPIIAMTANAMQGDDKLCHQAGMDDYMPKPIDGKVLEKMLSQYLQLHPSCTLG